MADLLSRFPTAPERIRALWLVMVPMTVWGAGFCFARRGERRSVPVYVVYEDADGRLMLNAQGSMRELPGEAMEETSLQRP